MSLKGSINRGEKWLRIYSDKQISDNPVLIADVKNYKEAMESTGIVEKPLKDMKLEELLKYAHQHAIDFGDEEPAIVKADLVKQIKAAEKLAAEE